MQHLHPMYVEGCYRCELSQDEIEWIEDDQNWFWLDEED